MISSHHNSSLRFHYFHKLWENCLLSFIIKIQRTKSFGKINSNLCHFVNAFLQVDSRFLGFIDILIHWENKLDTLKNALLKDIGNFNFFYIIFFSFWLLFNRYFFLICNFKKYLYYKQQFSFLKILFFTFFLTFSFKKLEKKNSWIALF